MIKKGVFKLSKDDQLLVDKILSFEHNIHMPKNISTSLNYTNNNALITQTTKASK